ncbi:3-deoxy-D-manno-octulosonic acid transferase [Celeribacter indicus]|uniref:3-deoxy-D-manno-octulosonic acid transferase n=1 Tax=Celeribacter indicus TaxID=1208324 RepID=A0A0B5E0H2_9RHOB|nr:glycosyltransferase N-terminal domain-containing protein [Celeribacter indicus]AJE45967.1 3-deoxy-D-manno-octulosonic-acid transferase [Celeribacter indicus]SDW64982.1 3-deoxy-D-manno-octulosonic-acid transferase [Celeribacter indicus]
MLLYRLLLTALSPVFALVFLRQILRGRERLPDLGERLGAGLVTRPSGAGPLLWVHGASNGELTAARALIEEALARAPSLEILVTANTVSARRMVRGWGLPRVSVRLAPLDLRPVLDRFLDATTPAALVSIENEIWPNRFALLARRGIPVVVAGARMSERTARRWLRMMPVLGATTRQTVAAITRLAAQDTASEQRLLQLGLPARALLPRMNLKSTVEIGNGTGAGEAEARGLSGVFLRDRTILAASTHAGEERIVLEAFDRVLKSDPQARLILAPRHPARAEAVAEELRRSGLAFARRGRGEAPERAPVYLADTLGEMPLWYRLAGICFVGGSLVARGGHTPFEPVQFGAAVLHGPHVANHQAAYRALDAAGGARPVHGLDDLAAALDVLVTRPEEARTMAEAGRAALAALRDSAVQQEAFWSVLAEVPGLEALR